MIWYADVHQTLTKGQAPTVSVLQKWDPYSPTIRWRHQRQYFISDWPRDMSNGVGALWWSCLTVTVLCRSTWMTWRRRTSASSSASTSWRRGYSRSMRRAAKTCTARWVRARLWARAAPQGPKAGLAESVFVWLQWAFITAVFACHLGVFIDPAVLRCWDVSCVCFTEYVLFFQRAWALMSSRPLSLWSVWAAHTEAVFRSQLTYLHCLVWRLVLETKSK